MDPQKKNLILNSRQFTARNLLTNCPTTVKTIITASAVGIYGDRGNEELTEQSAEGGGFLAEVCKVWEKEFNNFPVSNISPRTVILRIGMVLSKNGGALKKLQYLFRMNLGAKLSNGQQWMSYISLNDLTNVISQALINSHYSGVINVVNNSPVTNAEFTKALCKKLNVIMLPSVPVFMLRLLLGEMSQLVLASTKVKPQKLNELGFMFQDTDLAKIFAKELPS